MYYAEIKNYDIANGFGVRVSLFVSGCPHHCKGCFNEIAWNYKYGKPFTEKEIDEIISLLKPSYIRGLSLLGGEPMYPDNQKALLPLLKKVKEVYKNEKDIWCYSGYLFDDEIMKDMYEKYPFTKEILSYIDVLVDGRFDASKAHKGLVFRGSANQRIIDVPKSLKEKKIMTIPVNDKTFQKIERGV